MRRVSAIYVFVLVSTFLKAQDSSKVFFYNNEIGFNTVSLIKQIISNNPTVQPPYSNFHTIYFIIYIIKTSFGHAGRPRRFYQSTTMKLSIEGQYLPRTTDQSALNLRLGLSYNFVRTKKITLNCFADFIIEQFKTQTLNTDTIRPNLSPLQTITTKSNDQTIEGGGQIGVGAKVQYCKTPESIYIEVPFCVYHYKNNVEFYIRSNRRDSHTYKLGQKFTDKRSFYQQISLFNS